MAQTTYTFVKNVKGKLVISLDTFDMQAPTRNFVISHTLEKIVVPYNYALGLFVSPSALSQYRNGYFKIENVKELIRDGIERGLAAREEFPDVIPMSDIESFVKANNVKKIKSILDKKDPVEVQNLLVYARENVGNLTVDVRNQIENACGVELELE